MADRDRSLLHRAVALARHSVDAGGGPFGAVIADVHGTIVAEGNNVVTVEQDPTAHAEIEAIRRACRTRGSHRLDGLVLFSSCEPCPMCLAAAWWARLDGVRFASPRTAAAAAGFDDGRLWQAVSSGNTAPELPVHQIPVADAGTEFRQWLERMDRIPY